MEKVIFISLSLSIVLLFCGSTSASIEDMFSGIEPSEPNNGLVLEIALPKQEYFFFEPVTVFARFRNTTDSTIALALESIGLSGIDSKITWKSTSLEEKKLRPSNIRSAVIEWGTIKYKIRVDKKDEINPIIIFIKTIE